MSYKILEHEKAIKFKRKHKKDKQLILRIEPIVLGFDYCQKWSRE